MRLRHLGWAGVEIEHDGHTLLVDCLQDAFPLIPSEGMAAPSKPGATTAALVTHLHSDHADPVALAAALAPGAPVFRPEPNPGAGDDLAMTAQAERQFRETGLRTEVVPPWEERRVGPFRILAAPSVDGFGDPQRCWIVEAGGTRILHAGDTLFHGYWWAIARAVGPIDVAFLPVNGAVVRVPFVQPPSPRPAVMLPEEAVTAARLLRATVCVPIHHGLHRPPEYVETPRAAERFTERAGELGAAVLIPTRGEWFAPT